MTSCDDCSCSMIAGDLSGRGLGGKRVHRAEALCFVREGFQPMGTQRQGERHLGRRYHAGAQALSFLFEGMSEE